VHGLLAAGANLELDATEWVIGDYDGLAEQVGSQDWQQAGMG
jgi:hypothetical protein